LHLLEKKFASILQSFGSTLVVPLFFGKVFTLVFVDDCRAAAAAAAFAASSRRIRSFSAFSNASRAFTHRLLTKFSSLLQSKAFARFSRSVLHLSLKKFSLTLQSYILA